MNSLKEYDLRTPPPFTDNDVIKNSVPSEETALLPGATISAHGDEHNGDCGIDLKRWMKASPAIHPDPAAAAAAAISSKSFSSAAGVDTAHLFDGEDIDKGKQSECHPNAGCNGKVKPQAEAAAAANTALNAGVNFDAESVQEFGLDLKALGMHGIRRTMSTGDGNGNGNGGHGSAMRERVAPAASATYRRREASVAAVGACLVSSSVRKDGKVW